METKVLSCLNQVDYAVNLAVELLSAGKCIVFPTETVYGLGADAFNEKAIEEIYNIKQRNNTKPLSLHLANLDRIEEIAVDIPDIFYKLAEKYLPGPLNIILKKSNLIPDYLTSGMKTIGIRFPDDPNFNLIAYNFNSLIAATSANISDSQDSITADEARSSLKELIPLIIDSGPTKYQKPSTVLSVIDSKIKILREGVISRKDLELDFNRSLFVD